ncbi:hypothetical protein SK3146_03226 [Paenibacillus konkukensis]|uniref:Uncharacterized protein n=1 Tax=Paenibacillus konkukensis TaxID=2020716 RepID=A0ABY4RRJ6_9BACL|nr:hypothetical protein [Paenibacillus konkukensis]UQZ84014.1 hypothetical protein SK3146_03226 [Paenibacillus konkukensis]
MEPDNKLELDSLVERIVSRGITDRAVRIRVIRAFLDSYLETGGERPAAAQLECLADYILQEELKDPDPYKMSHNEAPIMSAYQYDLRTRRETSLKIAEEIGSDGKRYAAPKRRRRSGSEMLLVDEQAKIRNEQRAAKYLQDTKPGPVVTYNLRNTGGAFTDTFLSSQNLRTKK